MLIVTSNDIPGHRIDAVFGEVMGLTVRSRDITAKVMAGFRSLGGGEVLEMTRALYESRQQVMARMVEEALFCADASDPDAAYGLPDTAGPAKLLRRSYWSGPRPR